MADTRPMKLFFASFIHPVTFMGKGDEVKVTCGTEEIKFSEAEEEKKMARAVLAAGILSLKKFMSTTYTSKISIDMFIAFAREIYTSMLRQVSANPDKYKWTVEIFEKYPHYQIVYFALDFMEKYQTATDFKPDEFHIVKSALQILDVLHIGYFSSATPATDAK